MLVIGSKFCLSHLIIGAAVQDIGSTRSIKRIANNFFMISSTLLLEDLFLNSLQKSPSIADRLLLLQRDYY